MTPKTHKRKADSGKKYNRANGIIYKAGSGEHSTRTYGSNKGSIIKREDNGGYVISSCEAGSTTTGIIIITTKAVAAVTERKKRKVRIIVYT